MRNVRSVIDNCSRIEFRTKVCARAYPALSAWAIPTLSDGENKKSFSAIVIFRFVQIL